MITFDIGYDISDLKKLADAFPRNMGESALPNTATAFRLAAEKVSNAWKNKVSEMPEVTSAMVQSILIKQHERDFDETVYTQNRKLIEMEEGSPAVEYDMKRTHPYGKKSRVSKKGVPYLIIPFRWGTSKTGTMGHKNVFSGVIPTKIYNTKVKALGLSSVATERNYFEANARGEMIERKGYEWIKSSRLQNEDAWDDRSRGMVRMKDVRGSQYFTFRIISAKSPAESWIYKKKAKPAANYMEALVSEVQPIVDDTIQAGMDADVQDIMSRMNSVGS